MTLIGSWAANAGSTVLEQITGSMPGDDASVRSGGSNAQLFALAPIPSWPVIEPAIFRSTVLEQTTDSNPVMTRRALVRSGQGNEPSA